MNTLMDDEYRWIDCAGELSAFCERIATARRLGVDTEANGFHAYRPRLCLIQVAAKFPTGIEVGLVDALAFDQGLAGLETILEDPGVEKTIHGADNDIRLFFRDSGVSLRGLFDTQIAARMLGERRTGLASLAEELLGRKISKSGQRLDWAKRPLGEAACRYAAEDATILFALRNELAGRLKQAGRQEWAREECLLLEQVRYPPEQNPSDEELVSRLSGSHKLSSQKQTVLRELLLWREKEAQRRDVPPVHVVPPRQVLALAKQDQHEKSALSRAGISPRIIQRYGRSLLLALRKGRESEPWVRERAERKRRSTADSPPGLLDRFKHLRSRKSADLGIEEGALCSSAVLRQVAKDQPASTAELLSSGLRKWQLEVFGEDLLEALRGPS